MTIYSRFGLLGWPLGHSLSVPIHHAALEALGLNGEYTLFPYEPSRQGLSQLRLKLDEVKKGILRGLNVTIPYKQTVIDWLDELTPTAKAIGAVNTIFLSDMKLVGENTDAPGFMADIQASPIFELLLSETDSTILILGAGGSARAVIYSLIKLKKPILIAARRLEQAVELVASMKNIKRIDMPKMMPLKLNKEEISRSFTAYPPVHLIINTTPVGMKPFIQDTPWPSQLPFPSTTAVYDLVYNPQETTFLRCARNENLIVRNGLGMLVEQAALAFERWTNISPPREPMYEAAISALQFTN